MLENYVADSVQEQAASVPQWGSSRNFDPHAHRRDAEVGSQKLLKALCEHHPEYMPTRLAKKPEPVRAEIVFLPVEKNIETIFEKCPPIKLIVAEVAKFYGLTMTKIAADRRSNDIVRPRHVAIWLCRELTTASYPLIGKYLGGRDHTTCINAVRQVDKRLLNEDRLADEIQIIKLRILDQMQEVAA